jgi:hypothetical protein
LIIIFSWNSEGKSFVPFRQELENVIRIQIYHQPHKNNYGKRDKARAVFHCCEKGKQKYPEDGIISFPDQGEWVSEPLFD